MSEWRQTTVGELLTLEYGKPLPENARDGQGFPVYGSNGIVGYHSRAMVTGPGVIVGRKGTGSSGAVNFSEGDFSPIDTAFYVSVKDSVQIGMEFACHLLVNAKLTELATQTGVPGLTRSRAYEIRVALPPMPLQERIVEIIGAVDDQITALGVEADALDELWWALGREMAAVVAEEGTVPLASFCDISGGFTKNKKDLEQPDLVEVPYLRVANVHRHHLNLSEVATIQTTRAKAEKLRLHPGDVLMNEGGDKDKLGRGHVWEGQIPDCIHQNHVFRVRVTDQRFDPYFVSAWGNTFGREWFETFGTQTTGIASINRATLSRFPVPDVPLSVQQDWAGRLGAVVETMDSLRVQAASLRQVRAGLLSGLLDRTINIESAEPEV